MSQKKQGKDCGQTKIAIVAFSPSKSEDTSTKPIQQRTQLLSVMHKLVLTPLSRPFFSCWEGRDEAVSLKKPIRPRNHVRTSMNDSFCSANMTVVGAFFSPNKQTTPISAHECCKTRGGGGSKGLFRHALALSNGSRGLRASSMGRHLAVVKLALLPLS